MLNEIQAADVAYAVALHSKVDHTRKVCWSTKGLDITRLRVLTEPGYPVMDVSYCYGMLNGEHVEVQLPFSQIPKYNHKAWLIKQAKDRKIFVKNLVSNISRG